MPFNKIEVDANNPVWEQFFTEREKAQIKFSQVYAEQFKHGATGHNDMIIIAKLAWLLNHNSVETLNAEWPYV